MPILALLVVAGLVLPGSRYSLAAQAPPPEGGGQSPAASGARQTVPRRPKVMDRLTPLLEKMTPEQREHARFIQDRYKGREKDQHNIVNEGLSLSVFTDGYSPAGKPARKVLRELARSSGGVFLGRVGSATAFPSEKGTTVFTDYEIDVVDVYKSPARAPLDTVVVIIEGGTVDAGDVPIRVSISHLPAPEVGHDYLFFVESVGSAKQRPTFYLDFSQGLLEVVGGRLKAVLLPKPIAESEIWAAGIEKARVDAWLRK